MGPYAGVDYKSPYLIVNSVVSYPPKLQRERGGVGKISPIDWVHLYPSDPPWFPNVFYVSMGNPMPELTFTLLRIAGFNSHKISMNLDSWFPPLYC